MTKKRKPVGRKVPCKKGKSHAVGMTTGVCKNCGKYLMEPDMSPADLRDMQNAIARAMS